MKKHITNIISQLFGRFASCEFPYLLQVFINKAYVYLMGLDMSEYADAKTYKSLNALFTRSLQVKRDVDMSEVSFISPCDALISEQGLIKDYKAFQIKGMSYDVASLLGDFFLDEQKQKLKNGSFLNLYLSPRDYHRYHVPCDLRVCKAAQISGKLYPVNFRYLNKVASLFCENERVILQCESESFGTFYLVFVGALNVGKMVFGFDERIKTNAKVGEDKEYVYEDISFKKGDELGMFEMGSTIVALFEDENIELKKGLEKVRFGEVIAEA